MFNLWKSVKMKTEITIHKLAEIEKHERYTKDNSDDYYIDIERFIKRLEEFKWKKE